MSNSPKEEIEVVTVHLTQESWDGAMLLMPHKPTRPCPKPWDDHPGCRWVRCWMPQHHLWKWMPVDIGIADLVEAMQGPGALTGEVSVPGKVDGLTPTQRRERTRWMEGHVPKVKTVASCQGHKQGALLPNVVLEDGRVLVVLDSMDEKALCEEHVVRHRTRKAL